MTCTYGDDRSSQKYIRHLKTDSKDSKIRCSSKIAGINCAVQGKFLRQDVIPVTDLKLTSSRRNIVTIQVYEVAYMEQQVVRKRIDAKAFRI